jgi:hypothetical protein
MTIIIKYVTVNFYFNFGELMKQLLLYFSMLTFTLTLTANDHEITQAVHIDSLIYPHETDKELQEDPTSSLETSLREFKAKGGTLIRLDGDTVPYQILPGDMVFPSCSGAQNRSQTLWNLLRPYSDRISLKQPHATFYGFDPYNGKANWLRKKSSDQVHNDEFHLWAGVARSPKLGWNIFEGWFTRSDATPEVLETMLNYYTREYFNPDIPAETRRIYITFQRNAHIHLYRLHQTNDSLENVVVLFYPIDDLIKHPLPEWDAAPRSIKTYIELAKKLERHLDLSQLQ